jgi:hypothetical protein
VRLKANPLASAEQQAQLCGVSVETLVNLWIQQKLAEESLPCVAATARSHDVPQQSIIENVGAPHAVLLLIIHT